MNSQVSQFQKNPKLLIPINNNNKKRKLPNKIIKDR